MTIMADKITGSINELVVIDPPEKDWSFFRGESRTLTWKLQNTSPHYIKNIDFTAKTVIVPPEGEDFLTKTNYAEVKKVPSVIPPDSTREVKVTIKIPSNYNETVVHKGRVIEYPFRVKTSVRSLKHIQEL